MNPIEGNMSKRGETKWRNSRRKGESKRRIRKRRRKSRFRKKNKMRKTKRKVPFKHSHFLGGYAYLCTDPLNILHLLGVEKNSGLVRVQDRIWVWFCKTVGLKRKMLKRIDSSIPVSSVEYNTTLFTFQQKS